ncbi:MAG TPA: hypothetical protein VE544_12745 [Nitrososphaeraceae archaeon]|nr:hypothetical protein [Nitrososphaeraceae archaeon]
MDSKHIHSCMNGTNEVLSKFGELEDAMKTHFGKVDPRLMVDMIFRHRGSKKDPIYTLEVFIKPNQNTDQIREMIIERTGMVPAFYDSGTHVVVAHKISFELLKEMNDRDFVESIKGTYSGSGIASIGPTYER